MHPAPWTSTPARRCDTCCTPHSLLLQAARLGETGRSTCVAKHQCRLVICRLRKNLDLTASWLSSCKPLICLKRTEVTQETACSQVLGETVVLSANGQGGLATVALRPSGIFGPGDPLFVPTLVDKARLGKMKYIIGGGSNVMDFTYVGNVAQAHLQVGLKPRAVLTSRQRCAGERERGGGVSLSSITPHSML